MIGNISFTAKIPTATCSVLNKATGKLERAVIYEYDCRDESDLESIEKVANEGTWKYARCVLLSARCKYRDLAKNKYPTEKIYALENQAGQTLNLCNINDGLNDTTINFIETKQDSNYKYCGQNMVAMIAKKAFEEFKDFLIVHRARQGAWKFYIKNCGFAPMGLQYDNSEVDMIMTSLKFKQFIKETEQKSGGKIENIYA